MRQEAAARFLSTRLFQFFVADVVTSEGELVIDEMVREYFESEYEISAVLRVMFNSEYFKSDTARYARVKGPVESVVGTARIAGSYAEPTIAVTDLWAQTMYMGQGLLAPPTVEGWHEGMEWIDSGALVERVNFAAKELGNPDKPGVQSLINRLTEQYSGSPSPEEMVDGCLDLVGPIEVADRTREGLIYFATSLGEVILDADDPSSDGRKKVADTLSMIASTREYQLA